VPWWTWIALGVFALTVVATAIFAAWSFGGVKGTQTSAEAIMEQLQDVARRSEELERRLERTSARAEEVQRDLERLQRSLERLGVVGWALGDARRTVAHVRGAYLRK
jgi:uncharacterized protein HemX